MANRTPQGGCSSVAILIVAMALLIGNILFHTQESYLINYLGQSYEGKIVSVDSTHTGYGKYRFEYKIIYITLVLAGLLVFFVKTYFVFRKTD